MDATAPVPSDIVTTVTALTPAFTGSPVWAVAQAPDGYVVTGGGFEKGHPDQAVTGSRPTEDGTGWYVRLASSPMGYQCTVYARCLQIS